MNALTELQLRRQLAWAIEFVEREVKCWEDSYRDPKTGECDDEDVSIELADARRWLTETMKLLEGPQQ